MRLLERLGGRRGAREVVRHLLLTLCAGSPAREGEGEREREREGEE